MRPQRAARSKRPTAAFVGAVGDGWTAATGAAAVCAGTGLWQQTRPGGRGCGYFRQAASAAVVLSNGFAARGWTAESEADDHASKADQAHQAQLQA